MWKKALNAFQSAHDLHPKREEYIAALGEAYAQLEEYDQAQFYFSMACETAPELSVYWIQHARFLMEINDFEQALDVLDEGEVYAYDSTIFYAKAALHFAFGYRKEAFNILDSALQENFTTHQTLFDLIPELKNDAEVLSAISFHK